MGKTVLITGASRGLGKAIALKLAEDGYAVGLIGRSEEALNQVKKECEGKGASALALVCDVKDEVSVDNALQKFMSEFSQLDNVVINHGVGRACAIQDDKEQTWRNVLQTNLISAIQFTHKIMPLILKSEASKRAIVFTASIASKTAFAKGSAYAASKHGLLGFANSVFEDIRETGIKVTTLMPGYINTDMVKKTKTNKAKMIQVAELADLCAYVMAFPNTSCPTEITIRPQRTPFDS